MNGAGKCRKMTGQTRKSQGKTWKKPQKRPFGRGKTSDIPGTNIGTFASKHRRFCPKKSDVLPFPVENAEKSLHQGVHFSRTDGFAMPGTDAPGTLRKGKFLKFSRQRNVDNAIFVWFGCLSSEVKKPF